MKRRWLLIGLVVAVTAAIDLVLIPWVGPWYSGVPPWVHWVRFPMFAMAPCHGSLLAVWTALGGRATPWRLVAAVLGLAAWLWILNERYIFKYSTTCLQLEATIFAAEMLLLSSLLMLARLLGLELTDTSHGDGTQATAGDGQWIQFSLRTLMSWTTAVAVLLATLRYCPKRLLERVFDKPLIFAAILLGSAITALAALWIALGSRWAPARIVVLVVTSVVGVTLLQLAVGSREELGDLITYAVAQAVYLVISLWLVRLAGYRLVWRRRVRL